MVQVQPRILGGSNQKNASLAKRHVCSIQKEPFPVPQWCPFFISLFGEGLPFVVNQPQKGCDVLPVATVHLRVVEPIPSGHGTPRRALLECWRPSGRRRAVSTSRVWRGAEMGLRALRGLGKLKGKPPIWVMLPHVHMMHVGHGGKTHIYDYELVWNNICMKQVIFGIGPFLNASFGEPCLSERRGRGQEVWCRWKTKWKE